MSWLRGPFKVIRWMAENDFISEGSRKQRALKYLYEYETTKWN